MAKIKNHHEEASEIFNGVGRAISHWAATEQVLSIIFQTILDTDRASVVCAAFYSVHSFNSKLRMVNAAFNDRFLVPLPNNKETPLSSALVKKWKKIHEKLKRVSETRNQLAHRGLVYEVTSEVVTPALSAHPFKSLRESMLNGKAKSLKLHEIQRINKNIVDMHLMLEHFLVEDLMPKRKLQQISDD